MDSIEQARAIAARLHSTSVNKGRDPTKPYDFVRAEIMGLDLCVEMIKPGGAQLDGGRAKFIREDMLILHERCDTDFENAFLAAHELGHFVLGDDKDPTSSFTPDPTRPSEPSPIGKDRVVDYGKRQRREVQMDLFAREFLLPRSVVRHLHLDESMSATQIAVKFGAPFDVVAQQLLDALLLPVIEEPISSQSVERPLNCKQSEAASHRGPPLLVEAGPGTGKTQTLTSRVNGLLAEGIDPRSILLLTFSNKAAAEMADRIAEKNKDASAAMWIGTFHAFGLDLIRRFHVELGLEKDPRMIDRTEAVELLEEEFPKFGLEHYRDVYDPSAIIDEILKAISRAKDEVVSPEVYQNLAKAMQSRAKESLDDELRIRAEKCLEVAAVYDAYERIKRANYCVDFGDLVSMPVLLLESSPDIASTISQTYSHVLVDEYQDVNRGSVRLLKAICPNGTNLWAVGDAKQSIYRFRGASSFNMKRFGNEDFSGGQRKQLEKNYRSVPEITDAFSDFATTMAAGTGTDGLAATRDKCGDKVELRTVDQKCEQTLALADAIEEMRTDGHAYSDQAILCTGNEKLSTLAGELERLGIPVLFLGSLFERSEVKDLLAYLSLLTDRRAMGVVRIGCHPAVKMTLADVAGTIGHLRDDRLDPGDWVTNISSFSDVSNEGKLMLSKIAETLSGFDESSSPWTVLATLLLDRTRMVAEIATSDSITDRTGGIAVWQFLNFLRAQPAGKGLLVPRLLDRIRRLVRLGDDRDLRKLPDAANGIDGVRLMTIHGAKGLEFPVVHLPGLNRSSLPKSFEMPKCPPPDGMIGGAGLDAVAAARAGHDEEQECLFYVAMSRARDRLIGYAPTKKANNHRWPLSPFLDRLGDRISQTHITPADRIADSITDAAVPVKFGTEIILTAAQIGLYQSCPRRFLYTHVLHVGGRRKETPYMLMHDTVREICREIVLEGATALPDREIELRVSRSFKKKQLDDHGYEVELSNIAIRLVRYFVLTRQSKSPKDLVELAVGIDGDQITFSPDDCFLGDDGSSLLFRQMRTGGYKSKTNDLAAGALLLAAHKHSAENQVELVHLSSEETKPLKMTEKVLSKREETLRKTIAKIRAGEFPPVPSPRTCPNCPAFFICGQVPEGELEKTF
ncbi:UvrD-helicase domain-containing protein [Rhodopirellula bahusiensis]|uniref:UvrD-helicase domain-containing protein n=1 Tax=Rhodopirellula bahusiensis TaxID=2014065 RepID=UPI003262FBD1